MAKAENNPKLTSITMEITRTWTWKWVLNQTIICVVVETNQTILLRTRLVPKI